MIPADPIEPGRLVTYRNLVTRRDASNRASKSASKRGWDFEFEEKSSILRQCHWEHTRWQIELCDGTTIELSEILAVAELDSDGEIIASWTTQELWTEDECAR